MTIQLTYAPQGGNRRIKRSCKQWIRERVIKERGHACEWCGYPGYIELHHILEVTNGGSDDNDNLLLLCEKHHAKAHGWTKRKYLDPHREHWQGVSA